MMLRNGADAPAFALLNQKGERVSSEEVFRQISVICFHRGTFCPTTDRFLTAYQDFYKRLKEIEVNLIFISADTAEQNAVLTERLKLKFPLLSDSDVSVGDQYGVYLDKHRSASYHEPALFITDIDGKIAYSVISSGPKGLPSPNDVAPILMYMKTHNGKY